MSTIEIPTERKLIQQSSAPYSLKDVLENCVNWRRIEYASTYYLETNWLFAESFAVLTPQRHAIDVVQYPGTRHEQFRACCSVMLNRTSTEPIELGEPRRIEVEVSHGFAGTPGKKDRRWIERWISYEVYPVQGDGSILINRRYLDTIKRLSRCRTPQLWRTFDAGQLNITDRRTGRLIGIVAPVENRH